MKRILIATNSQKILDFLLQNAGRQYLSGEIQKATRVSKAGTNFALKDLAKTGLLKKERRGKFCLYSLDFSHPVIKQLKVLRTVMSLSRLLRKVATETKKVILYGSSSRGEDTKDSDIDLFVVTNTPDVVRVMVETSRTTRKIQLTTRTPLKYVEMEKTDPTFFREVERGAVLWESIDER